MKKGTRIFWIIAVCIILPGVAFMSCMWCLKISGDYISRNWRRLYYRNRRSRSRGGGAVHNPSEMATTTVPRPLFTAAAAAAEARPRRNRCAICLQDYQQPVQGHWLMNSRCPTCYWDSFFIISSPEMEMETGWTSPIPQPTMSSSSSLRNSMAPTSTNTTTHQTLLYTPKVFEDSERLPRPGEISCAICRDNYVVQERLGLVNGCQHSFHAHCLQSWLDTSPTCPLCRISLSSIPTSF